MFSCAELYPGEVEALETEGYFGVGDYQPLLNAFGTILLQVDDTDYQGDSRVLYEKDDLYGVLIFGWGSCSGCDALQACGTPQEVEELAITLYQSIQWLPLKEQLAYMKNHDWAGDFSWHAEETQQFVAQALALLEGIQEAA